MRLSTSFILICIITTIGCDDPSGKITDPDPICGNGAVEVGELCDGDCPIGCDDLDPCTVDVLSGTPETCDAVCSHTEKTTDDCTSLDGCCPAGCEAAGDLDCPGLRPAVALVIAKEYSEDTEIRSRIERYQADHPSHEFHEILYDKSTEPISSMEDRGGEIKRNWVEVRNTVRDLAARFPLLAGVWVIADSLPLIWREESLFAISPSQYKASIYPLVATAGDYYTSFDADFGGFTEAEGATIGRSRGDGYPADLWGAALVPVAGWGYEKDQLADFFDRNHELVTTPPVARSLLYADTFGFTSRLAPRIDDTGVFSSQDTLFLGPNSSEALDGFSSYYNVMVHKLGEDFVPAGSGGCLMAQGQDQIDELNEWSTTIWFPDQVEFRRIGDDRCYYFSLLIRDRSLPPQTIRDTLAAALPPLACDDGACTVHVADTYFADSAGVIVDGNWNAFPDQQAAFHTLYSETLESGEVLYSYISTHGAPEMHHYGITSQFVHDSLFSALVYELQACSTADLASSPFNLAGTYLFYGEAQAVTGYSQPSVINCSEGECFDYMHFLDLTPGGYVIEALFDRDYSMHLYLGDPLLILP
ncbi:hypothetical protein KKD52_10870 [Myxococcota bacterium]|nr:hypothetical protein [Myxococcota bacterium]MBU1413091.1 hypothetical protein [Myxococcota bacterium]MBU1510853.1 hypothetical protein [Myxococcota bacterium]